MRLAVYWASVQYNLQNHFTQTFKSQAEILQGAGPSLSHPNFPQNFPSYSRATRWSQEKSPRHVLGKISSVIRMEGQDGAHYPGVRA